MSVLDSIIAGVREDLEIRKSQISVAQLEELISASAPVQKLDLGDFGVIAEVKRSSPSKGELAKISDPAQLASAYRTGGAAAISVLTEQRRFSGDLADLTAVRQAVCGPVLRKDFMVDSYQFIEARAYGADLVLLIVAALSDAQLREYHAQARNLGLGVLVEVHDEAELHRAVEIPDLQLVGINARNLRTLDVDLATCHRLLPFVPVAAVAESGISTAAEVRELAQSGARGVLVGETLVKSGDPVATVQSFIAAGRSGHAA